jgi:hypothetical protein
MYMPVPAISHAITAPNGPVAPANVRGSEKMPAPTMLPTTIAINCIRDIFSSDEDITGLLKCLLQTFTSDPRLPLVLESSLHILLLSELDRDHS